MLVGAKSFMLVAATCGTLARWYAASSALASQKTCIHGLVCFFGVFGSMLFPVFPA